MNKKAIDNLLDALHFYNYDKDYERYEQVINELVKKYDYESVCDRLMKYPDVANRNVITNKFLSFSNYMKYCEYEKKLSDQEYMDRERKDIEDFKEAVKEIFDDKGKKRPPTNELSDFGKKVMAQRPDYYLKYTTSFLLEKSKEFNISISQICERKGLFIQWVLWDI